MRLKVYTDKAARLIGKASILRLAISLEEHGQLTREALIEAVDFCECEAVFQLKERLWAYGPADFVDALIDEDKYIGKAKQLPLFATDNSRRERAYPRRACRHEKE